MTASTLNISKATGLIGNTPLVDLSGLLGKTGVRLFGKVEGNNPGGSVKDRAALSMIEGATARGELSPGQRLIEPTSGNTGIALAMIAAMKGLEIELVMPASATRERVLAMQSYGAKVTLTPADDGIEGSIDFARESVRKGGCFMLDQFSNADNYRAHYRTTGPEIWRDTKGQLSHFVSAMGTTGTIMGCSRFLKEQEAGITIVGAQPTDGSKIPGIRRWPQAYLPKIYEADRVDRIIDVSQEQATATTRRLATEGGLSVGMSSGGALWVALKVCAELEKGVVVVVLCDRGDRYLSSTLFRDEEATQ
jgi:S-sulfo-L-cysteine synthase (O-acetyl-L-serine-dependent)